MPKSAELSIRVLRTDDACVAHLQVSGELDISNSTALGTELRRAERRGASIVVLDLAGLHFMDVSGLRAILDAARRARRDGRKLVVANPLPSIVRLFELTAIDQSLDMMAGPVAAIT
jgi:anti-sigma B factor antagonist